MSKALVIKGANFSTNKVETITISDAKPCTGLSLSPNSITFTTLGATQQITAVKTPADTTDTLTWNTSNEDVAIVSDGVVTCIGIGTATITATCGSQTATCSVSCTSISYNLNEMYDRVFGYKNNYNTAEGRHYASIAAQTYSVQYYSATNETEGYEAFYDNNDTSEGKYCIPIPKGTTNIAASCSITNREINVILCVFDVTTPAEKRDSSSRDWSAYLLNNYGAKNNISYDISQLNNPNGYVICFYDASNPQETDYNESLTMTFT